MVIRWIQFSLPWFIIGALILLVPGLLVFRKRRKLTLLVHFSFLVPFVIWFLATFPYHRGRSLSNYVVEPLYLGFIAGTLQVLAAIFPGPSKESAYRRLWAAIIISVLAAISMIIWFPILPE